MSQVAITFKFDLTQRTTRKVIVDDNPAMDGKSYIGIAERPEAATGAALWMVWRQTVTSGVTLLEQAGGGGYNNIWDNRASLVYSAADSSQP